MKKWHPLGGGVCCNTLQRFGWGFFTLENIFYFLPLCHVIKEFLIAIPVIKGWGVKLGFPTEEFDCMDSNDGEKVLFDEFCE